MFEQFLTENWFNVVQTVFLILGFGLAAKSYSDDNKSRKVGHLLKLGRHYQKIKDALIERPELKNVFKKKPTGGTTVSPTERYYIQQTIMHIYTVYMAIQLGQLESFKGIEDDIKRYLKLPLPKKVWNEVKKFQDGEFVAYIDALLK